MKIVHLVDDVTAGGVMRMLTHLMSHPGMGSCDQSLRQVARRSLDWGHMDADVIVCHIAPGWARLAAFAALRARHPKARLVHVEHSYTRAFTALNVPRRGRFFAMLRVAYALFDQVVAVSDAQAAWLEARGLVDASRLRVIRPQTDLTTLRALPAPQGPVRRIGAIGRLEPQKGFDLLIAAFRECPDRDARLDIFGEGADRPFLERLAQGDARIVFHGHAKDPGQAFAAVDLVAIPSRWEAYGLVADEARAAGRPVILSPVDGLADRRGAAGVTLCPLAPGAWTAALRAVLGRDDLTHPDRMSEDGDYAQAWQAVFTGPSISTQQIAA